MFKESIENVILNIILTIVFGGVTLGFLAIFLEVFKIGKGAILKNKWSQWFILSVLLQVAGFTLLLLIEYGASFLQHGNFLIASMINNFFIITGHSFVATPMMNVLLTLLPIIFGMMLFYLFLPKVIKYWGKVKNQDTAVSYDEENKEMRISLKSAPSMRIGIQYFQTCIIFGTSLATTVQLWLFNNFIYPNILPKALLVFAICCSLFTVMYSIIFIWELRELTYSVAIQNLFEDQKDNVELLKIFERIVREGSLKLKGEEFFEALRNYVEIGVIEIFPKVSVNHLELEKNYKLEIPRQIKEVFESEREFRHRIT